MELYSVWRNVRMKSGRRPTSLQTTHSHSIHRSTQRTTHCVHFCLHAFVLLFSPSIVQRGKEPNPNKPETYNRSRSSVMGKKKPFIDRKNSSTYHVLHRSQRDVSQHHLMQDDDNNPDSSGAVAEFILWPDPGNLPATDQAVLQSQPKNQTLNNTQSNSKNNQQDCLDTWRRKLQQVGLLEQEEAAPDKYVKEMSGQGIFVAAHGGGSNALRETDTPSLVDADLLEVSNPVDNIPLLQALDEDMAAILYHEDNGDGPSHDNDNNNQQQQEEGFWDQWEALDDDFVLQAAAEPELHNDSSAPTEDGGFDFDAHIQNLMRKARQEREQETAATDKSSYDHHEWARRDAAFFDKALPRHDERDDEDDDSFANLDETILEEEDPSTCPTTTTMGTRPTLPGTVAKLSPDEERALRQKFEQTLLEYDDDDDEEDDEKDEGNGETPWEETPQMEAVLDDFLYEREDEILMQGRQTHQQTMAPGGGSGYSALVGTRMVSGGSQWNDPLTENDPTTPSVPVAVVLAEASARLAEPPLEPPPPSKVNDDGTRSYWDERERNPWDCESILSTYSNLDHRPVTIETSSRRRRRQQQHGLSRDDDHVQINLSNKTGLPLPIQKTEMNDDHSHFSQSTTATNKGTARPKKETSAEKRARKAALRYERQVARIQKKVTRQVVQHEFAKQQPASSTVDAVAGMPVFRY